MDINYFSPLLGINNSITASITQYDQTLSQGNNQITHLTQFRFAFYAETSSVSIDMIKTDACQIKLFNPNGTPQ